MSHLALLLPFGLPPAELSADLIKQLKVPALATLISRAKSAPPASRYRRGDDFQRALPHEIWLTQQLAGAPAGDNSPPVATALMRTFGLEPGAGTWFVLQPVHIHIARDHLVLTDPRGLELQETESRILFRIAEPLFAEVGKRLLYGDAGTWFVRADDWAGLQTATPDAAGGHNIDIWMPKGGGERDWRKLQNEVQMHWFGSTLNDEREAQRLKPVNSIWLWGAASAATKAATPATAYTDAFNLSGWMRAFEQYVPGHILAPTAKEALAARPEQGIAVLDALLEPALANDWGRWLECMHTLEADWFAPLLAGLKAGRIDQVSLIASHDTGLASFTTSGRSLKKFWVKPALTALTAGASR